MKILERVYASGLWICSSALHVGGETDAFDQGVDRVLLRDSDGRPFIPGASIAGSCRHWLSRRLPVPAGCRDCPPEIHVLFGDDYQSLLTVEDAYPESIAETLVRDGVKIRRDSGIAEDGAKYDFEALPARTAFRLAFSLILYKQPPDFREHRAGGDTEGKFRREGGYTHDVTNDQLREVFRLMLEAIGSGEIAFGAKTRRGLGHGTVANWSVHPLKMDQTTGLIAWLKQSPKMVPSITLKDFVTRRLEPHDNSFVIDATIALASSFLVRSTSATDNVEFVQRLEQEIAVVPGTSFGGAFRSRVEKIAKTLSPGKGSLLTEEMFGWVKKKSEIKNPSDAVQASRVEISEIALPGGRDRMRVQGRVSIDRFTGAALETALFDEAAYWPKAGEEGVHLRIALRQPKTGEPGLLLLAFKDLWLGDLTVGGESGIGRGRWRGISAEIRAPGIPPIALKAGDLNLGCSPDEMNQLNTWVSVARETLQAVAGAA